MVEYESPKLTEVSEESAQKVVASHLGNLIDERMQATNTIFERLRKDRRNPALWRALAKAQKNEKILVTALVETERKRRKKARE